MTPSTPISLLEAIGTSLSKSPALMSQGAQVAFQRGVQIQNAGAFDPALQLLGTQQHLNLPLNNYDQSQYQQLGLITTRQLSDQETLDLRLTKQFRTGVVVAPDVALSRSTDNLFAASGLNTSAIGVTVTIPLLRGRGRSVVDAQEIASSQELEATRFDYLQYASQLAADTATTYWNWISAMRLLDVAKDAERRGQSYLVNVHALIDADHVPRNDLYEVQANLSQRTAARISAEQDVIAAKQRLLLDMGLSAKEMTANIAALDDFPQSLSTGYDLDRDPNWDHYIDFALAHRSDLKAAEQRIRENETLQLAARKRLLHQLDLQSNLGYSGLKEGRHLSDFFTSTTSAVDGPSITSSLMYSFPIGNHNAKGTLEQATQSLGQSRLRENEAARTIASNLVTTIEAVRHAAREVEVANQAVASFEQALDGEREKYRVGIGSVPNILILEDRLNTALIARIQAKLAYTVSIVQFRFVTGTLVEGTPQKISIASDVFDKLPDSGNR